MTDRTLSQRWYLDLGAAKFVRYNLMLSGEVILNLAYPCRRYAQDTKPRIRAWRTDIGSKLWPLPWELVVVCCV